MREAATTKSHQLLRSHSHIDAVQPAQAVDEQGHEHQLMVAGEHPLTLYLNKREIVTLMTLGQDPEALILGYLRNQGLIEKLEHVEAVQVDWSVDAGVVVCDRLPENIEQTLSRHTVTTGCGQGTVFGHLLDRLDQISLGTTRIKQSTLYRLLATLSRTNEIYRGAGAVHGCALCREDQVLSFVEDVGRHNAVDTLAGRQWLEQIGADGSLFYTTGRITSEMVIKVAQMGVPILLSRSGITQMGLELGKKLGVTLIARAKGEHFLLFNRADRIELDAPPRPRREQSSRTKK